MAWLCVWLAIASLSIALHYRWRSLHDTRQLHRFMTLQSPESLRRILHDLRHGFPDEPAGSAGAHRFRLGESLLALTIESAPDYVPPVRDGEIWAATSGDSDAAIIHALITVTGTGST